MKSPHKARPSSPLHLPTPLSAPAHQYLNLLDLAFTPLHAHGASPPTRFSDSATSHPTLQEPQPTSWSQHPSIRTYPPPPLSNTFQRLRALLRQLDLAASPDASNSVMLLIAEAAIEASDYPDST